MRRNIFITLFPILFFFFFSTSGLCLNGEDILRMKQAAVSDQTIELMMREKVVETCAFTVQEIVDLKTAGISDKTIQMLIKEGSFLKDAQPLVYGDHLRHIRLTTVRDIIELKQAGVSDEVIKAIVDFSSKNSNDTERGRAEEILKDIGIIIDLNRDESSNF
jgi:hypothetical protein